MSDDDVVLEDDDDVLDDDDRPTVPAGYIPGNEEVLGQKVGDRGEVIPSPEEILEKQRLAREQGVGGGASPDTAAAGAEHEDR